MAYVRIKKRNNHEYYYLVEGHQDPETKKVRQKNLKYYGKEKPSAEQLKKDIEEFATTGVRRSKTTPEGGSKQPTREDQQRKLVKSRSFNLDSIINKENVKTILQTVWRNKNTHEIALIDEIRPHPSGCFELHSRLHEDKLMGKIVSLIRYGEVWKKVLEDWYRFDILPYEDQSMGFMRRQVWCAKQKTAAKKQLHSHRSIRADNRDDLWNSNLMVFQQEYEEARKAWEEAVDETKDFKDDWAQRKE